MFTYRDLMDKIGRMTDEQLDMGVSVWVPDDEILSVAHIELVDCQEEDRLDDGHPLLVVLDDVSLGFDFRKKNTNAN